MKKSIKRIEIAFENGDCIKIPINVLGDICISDIHEQIRRIGYNAIWKIQCADFVALEIFSNRYNRISEYRDVTSISVVYDSGSELYDGNTECFWVDFDHTSDDFNPNQKVYISRFGNLYLVISKDKGIEDYFNLAESNDEDAVKFRKKMLRINDGQE